MVTINLRDFPEELWHALKIRAATERNSLKGLIIEILQKDMESHKKGVDTNGRKKK